MEDLSYDSYVFSNAGQSGEGIKVTFGDKVTKIPAYLFYTYSLLNSGKTPKIISVRIGENVTSIGKYAFYKCASLTNITIPKNVTSIGSYAFYNCTSLTSITIPKNVTSIGDLAFCRCDILISIIVSAENANYESIDGNLYTKGGRELVQYSIGKKDTQFTIPSGVTRIDEYAFSMCTSLTSITIPESVTYLGEYAFYKCASLTNITIPKNVTSIGASTFENCTSLTSVTIGENVTSIGEYAFSNCTSLTSITIPKNVTSIGDLAFYRCDNLISIIVSAENANYESIDGNLYTKGERELIQYSIGKKDTQFTIPNGVTSIGARAFDSCTSLISIKISDSVTYIGREAFSGCINLTSVRIGENVTSIGSYAFYGCLDLTEISFNAISMDDLSDGNYVFSNAGQSGEGIKVTFGDKVTKIPAYLFYTHSLLNSVKTPKIISVTIGENVTSIGEGAFKNCKTLTEINFNAINMDDLSDVSYVFSNAGQSGEGIKVTFGDKVTKIPAYLFCSYYPKITSVILGESVTSIGIQAFFGCINLTSVTIGENVTSIGAGAFKSCTSLKSITIPKNVTSIGAWAFNNCTSLASVTFENTNGWYLTSSSTATSGISVDVTDATKNAKNLRIYYCLDCWKRNP